MVGGCCRNRALEIKIIDRSCSFLCVCCFRLLFIIARLHWTQFPNVALIDLFIRFAIGSKKENMGTPQSKSRFFPVPVFSLAASTHTTSLTNDRIQSTRSTHDLRPINSRREFGSKGILPIKKIWYFCALSRPSSCLLSQRTTEEHISTRLRNQLTLAARFTVILRVIKQACTVDVGLAVIHRVVKASLHGIAEANVILKA